ncbi:sugar ABC transporter ATP-binding protein [Shinella pollutisoli]|uniref:Sugar ABC transporter ATP-binding protein n=1 Tax=Shinella pollutisoli TaxID=2250594 RepID=A0ABV7DG04_9HYPH|nr:sugar ABC transporter ATP-binding protein [Shinella pollutisoli]
MTHPIFEARDITKSYGVVHALKGVSIGIGAGEIHAIIGENGAGKSTLMSIFCGKIRPSSGTLHRDGEQVAFARPLDAQRAGISIAPQEINLVPDLTVAENIMLGAHETTGPAIDWRKTRRKALRHLLEIDESIDPASKVHRLSKAQQQLVQIARAAATLARILILDEPTAALTSRETEKLFSYVRRFRAEGGSVFYISHRLGEILELADRITVLRDGAHVGELDPKTTTKDEMVRQMAGRVVGRGNPAPHVGLEAREVVLKVDGLTRHGEFDDVSFELHRGEILGVSGLIGAGRTEVAKCIFGLTQADGGTVELFGERLDARRSPLDCIAKGLVYLPEERKQEGIFPLLSIAENMTMPSLDRFGGLLRMRTADMLREVDGFVERLRIKLGSPADPITSLSGGNQQKVIIGRWLMRNARVLIMDEPTRGIDVAAKFEIQNELRRFTDREGLSIVFISSELEEVLDVSDRIVVMHEGKVKGIPAAAAATQESLLQLAMS